jgi:hypothetical protein
MPNTVLGAASSAEIQVNESTPRYVYDSKIDLKPGSTLHSLIIQRVARMAEDSFTVMSQRHKVWNQIDQTLKVYIPLKEEEKRIKYNDPAKPISIVVPYSYATLETILAYCTKAFLVNPVFQYEGSGPEDTIGAKLMELAVNQQVQRTKSILDIHTSLRDGFAYGVGASTMNWVEKWGYKATVQKVPQYGSYGSFIGDKDVKVTQSAMLFEGNEVIAIDPYRFLPDCNTSIHAIQDMEYVGWIDFSSYYKLIGNEENGSMTNVKYLKTSGYGVNRTSRYTIDNSKRIVNNNRESSSSNKYVTVINMYVTLIPKEWGLPGFLSKEGTSPEIWLFSIANETLVLRAQPLGLNHGQYPIAACAPDFDGYSITPLSRMELEFGLQDSLNWMFNSHVANVRKAINDMFIVDPSLINMEDLRDPEPGKLIRLRRDAWGRGVDGAIKQFNVTDITRTNMQDAEQIMGMMSRVSAASDATQGIMLSGRERVTAAEYSGTLNMAISRLDRLARIVSAQYLQDLAYYHASHTQQLMSEATYVKIAGDWPLELYQEFQRTIGDSPNIKVSPFDILVDYDVIFKDGSTATADAMANDFWTKSFQSIAANETLLQTFDITRIFTHMARLNGAKNVMDFVKKGGNVDPQMAGNEDVLEQAQAGNIVPVDEYAAAYGM